MRQMPCVWNTQGIFLSQNFFVTLRANVRYKEFIERDQKRDQQSKRQPRTRRGTGRVQPLCPNPKPGNPKGGDSRRRQVPAILNPPNTKAVLVRKRSKQYGKHADQERKRQPIIYRHSPFLQPSNAPPRFLLYGWYVEGYGRPSSKASIALNRCQNSGPNADRHI